MSLQTHNRNFVFGLTKIDVQSSILTFEGTNNNPNALDSDSTWRIARLRVQGSVTTREYADLGKFTQVWSDRSTIFPPLVVANTNSLDFGGTDGKGVGGDIHKFDNPDAFTFSMWIKPNNISTAGTLWAKTTPDSDVYGYSLKYLSTSGDFQVQMRAPSGLRLHTFTTSATASTWQNIVWTYSGAQNINGNSLYKDKIKDTSSITSGSITNSWLLAQDFTIGVRNNAFFANCIFNQMHVYNKELNQTEVDELYSAGASADPNDFSFSSSLVAWNKLGTDDVLPNAVDSFSTNDLTISGDVTKVSDVP